MAVEVFAADEQNDQPVDTLRWVHLAEAVLQEEGLSGDAELSVLFVDEPAIAELNSRFLGKDGPTDVLAFPIDEEPVESGRSPDSGGTGPGMPSEPEDIPVLLGDIVICPAVAFRNAPEHAGNYDDEVALLVVHGLLHLMGMDHQEDDEAEEMEAKERELLSRHYAEIRAETWQARSAAPEAEQEAAQEAGKTAPGDGQADGQAAPDMKIPGAKVSGPGDAAAASEGDAPSNGGPPADGHQPGRDGGDVGGGDG
jgi:probable rRNA maturation factor